MLEVALNDMIIGMQNKAWLITFGKLINCYLLTYVSQHFRESVFRHNRGMNEPLLIYHMIINLL